MNLNLTEEQRVALADQPDVPLRILDPVTNKAYFLVRAEVFERLRALVGEEGFDVREAYGLMDQVARKSGWDDPSLDIYNDLDPRKTL